MKPALFLVGSLALVFGLTLGTSPNAWAQTTTTTTTAPADASIQDVVDELRTLQIRVQDVGAETRNLLHDLHQARTRLDEIRIDSNGMRDEIENIGWMIFLLAAIAVSNVVYLFLVRRFP